MKYLVTGGCGFIGSHLCEALAAAGHTLTVLDDLSTGLREQLPAGATLLIGDVADAAFVQKAMQGVDACFHLAAIASVERSKLEWVRTHQVNLTGTINVFEAARAVGNLPVVYASSAAVYGDNTALPLNENSETKPLSAYGADKLGCELHARAGAKVHGLPSAGLRFFNCYGPRQDPNSPYSGVISIFARRILRGEPVTVFGNGQQTRDFIYVGDVVAHLLAAMSQLQSKKLAQGVFNVCTGKATSLLQLIDVLAQLTGKKVAPNFAAPREGDIVHSLGDASHAVQSLGVRANVALPEGLGHLLSFLEAQG